MVTQYVSKFGKLSSGHRTGKDQFSFQSQRRAMPENAQTTAQLYGHLNILRHCLSLEFTVDFSKFAGILSAALEENHLLEFEIAQLEFHHLH